MPRTKGRGPSGMRPRTDSLRDMDPDSVTHTGRAIPVSVQTGANPGAFRHMVVDPIMDLLLYAVTDGSVKSIDLTSLLAASFVMPSSAFDNAGPRAGRIITYDPPEANFAVLGMSAFGLPTLATVVFLVVTGAVRNPRRRWRTHVGA